MTPEIELTELGKATETRYSWTARAKWQGRRLAAEGRELTPDLIGYLARHEGADLTVTAVNDFDRTLRDAYESQIATVGFAMPDRSGVKGE